MKKLITVLAGVMVGCSAIAGPVLVGPIAVSSVPTNGALVASSIVTNDMSLLYGYVEYVAIDLTSAYANPTCTVSVATEGGSGTGAAQTILTVAELVADGIYHPLVTACHPSGASTNWVSRFPLYADRLVVTASGNNTTNNLALKVYVGLVDRP